MEIVKLLALASVVAFPLAALLTWLMGILIRTQYKWRKLPPPNQNSPAAPWVHAPKASK